MALKAVVFDLDGVITDTAHLHFLAWRAVAEEIGITFDEVFNEQLKGISRMDSLLRILKHGGKEGMFSDEQCLELATKKNARYVQSLASLTQDSLLPGIQDVLADIRAAKVKIGLASVSLNAPGILHALGIHQALIFARMLPAFTAQSQTRRFFSPPVPVWTYVLKRLSALKMPLRAFRQSTPQGCCR